MNRSHRPVGRNLDSDRIAEARRGLARSRRTRHSALAVALALACAGPAFAACPGAGGDTGGGPCPDETAATAPTAAGPDTATAPTAAGPDTANAPTAAGPDTATAPTAAGPDTANARPTDAADTASAEGRRELADAKKLIDAGEVASSDDARRRAYEAAKQHADRAVALMPNDADARFMQFAAEGRIAQLGGIAAAALQLVKLNKQLDEVLRLDPNHANALAARGGMLMKLPRLFGGNTTEGVEYLERAVSLDSTAVGKRLELAEAYHIVGRDDEARATAQSALQVAKQLDEPDRVATCERFIVELQKSCSGCAVASIGR